MFYEMCEESWSDFIFGECISECNLSKICCGVDGKFVFKVIVCGIMILSMEY